MDWHTLADSTYANTSVMHNWASQPSVCEISAMAGDPHPTDELPAEKLDTSEGPVADKPSVSTNGEVTPADDAEADDKELKLSVQQSATPNATANESETPSAAGAWFKGQPGAQWLKDSVGVSFSDIGNTLNLSKGADVTWKGSLQCTFFVFNLLYLGLASTSLVMFSCKSDGNGGYYVVQKPNIEWCTRLCAH